ncbi:MAG: SAM-dependent chlorinase/fluorinase [Anaerolineales bacterium]|nr:SAM-dependent chlorinase/fluorinase [Anaerolineales bacterium]
MGNASVVACITDFGTSDYYAGALRGVLAGLLPQASIVDVTHEIPPGDIRRAAILLWEAQPAFPKGTVFLAVVDPGVGTERRPSAIRFAECDVVCPDNGIAAFLMQRFSEFRAWEIDPGQIAGRPISNTFHGRDLFAPAAAHLALGKDADSLGSPLSCPVRIPLPFFEGDERRGWAGEVLYRDRFGNAVTSIGRISFDGRNLEPWLRTGARAGRITEGMRVVLEDGGEARLVRTYRNGKDGGGAVALVGSNGLLELACASPAAAGAARLKAGTRLRLAPAG